MRSPVLLACLVFSSCVSPFTVSPPDDDKRIPQNQEFLAHVMTRGRDGDWLVVRGYTFGDHLVTTLTSTPISHAAILDKERKGVIEATGEGVHYTDLMRFINKSHRILLIRPVWSTETSSREALMKARSLTGRDYDFLGTLGFNVPEQYYCSELVIYVYRDFIEEDETLPHVIEPGQLYLWGEILYDSRPRD